MTLIYLARHAETQFNKEGRLQGRSDSPLTELGIRQARQLGERLAGIGMDACFSSPSPRAVKTAELALNGRQVPLTQDERLMEMAMGDWEGRYFPDLERDAPELIARYRAYDRTFRAPGGETWFEVQARMVEAFHDYAARHPGGHLLVVSHGAAVRMLLGHCLGQDVSPRDIPRSRNCALSIIEWHADGARIHLQACDRHLAALG